MTLAGVLWIANAGLAAAGSPPAGVVLDAAVTVTVTRNAADGGAEPLAGATVDLIVYVSDFPEAPIQELTAIADAAGVAAFAGVARGDGSGPVVHLAAQAQLERILPDGECLTSESWYGLVSDVESADGLDIPVLADAASSIVCPPPGEEELPAGLVADAGLEVAVTLDGSPVDASVFAFVAWDGWSTVIEAAAPGGTAVFENLPRPEDPGQPVDVILSAISQIDDAVIGCTFTRTAEGGASLALTESGVVATAIELVLAPFDAPTTQQAVTVVDRDGAPVGGGSVFVVQTNPQDDVEPWSCHTTAATDGSVSVPLYDWGTVDSPSSVDVEAHGPITSTELRGDCVLSFGPYGLTSFSQAHDVVVDVVELVTDVIELDAVCSTTGEPSAPGSGVGGGGTEPTLPPTDARPAAAPTTASLLPAFLAMILVACAGLASSAAALRRRSR